MAIIPGKCPRIITTLLVQPYHPPPLPTALSRLMSTIEEDDDGVGEEELAIEFNGLSVCGLAQDYYHGWY